MKRNEDVEQLREALKDVVHDLAREINLQAINPEEFPFDGERLSAIRDAAKKALWPDEEE